MDRGGTRSMLNTNFEKEELEGKGLNNDIKNVLSITTVCWAKVSDCMDHCCFFNV